MLVTLYIITAASGNPSSLTSLLPGGVGVQNAGTSPAPFLSAPRVEQILREVLDTTSAGGVPAPAPIGALLSVDFTIVQGGQNWNVSPVAQDPKLDGQFGIVFKSGSTNPIDDLPLGSGSGALIVTSGPAQALCITPTAGGAIAPGTLLAADGAGNLQPIQPPAAAPTPTVTPTGGSATTWSYALVSVSANGTYSAVGTAGTNAAGAATLTVAAYNTITWTPVADAVGYIIVRTVAGTSPNTVGAIGSVGAGVNSFVDNGLAIQTGTTATQPFVTLAAGGTPTVVQVAGATAGSATWGYKISAISFNGVWGAAGSQGTVTTGASTLSVTQGNKITWTATAGAVRYAIQRSASGGTPSSTGLIGFASPAQATTGFVDYGQAATTFTQNLTPTPLPQNGIVMARSLGTLAVSTTTPTLVPVFVGQA
jgi:hypothetical protein